MLLRSLKLLLFLQENFVTKTKNAKAYKHFVYFVFFICMSYTETLQSQILCDVAHIYKKIKY